jgi:integrase
VRLYLQPHLGPILLAELTTAHVQAMFTAIIRQHHASGRPITAATLARIRATLRAAQYRDPPRPDHRQPGPSGRTATGPPPARSRMDRQPGRALRHRRTATRRGEAAGLRWCDVDLDDGVAVLSRRCPCRKSHPPW